MLIFAIAVDVPTLKELCNSDCPGYCSYSGFDLNCHCEVPLIEIDVEDGGESSGESSSYSDDEDSPNSQNSNTKRLIFTKNSDF